MYTQEEARQIRKEFWDTFAKRCEIVPELKHRKKKWVLYDTKISGIDLKFEVDRNEALVILEINNRQENRRLQIFEILEKYKRLLEEGFDDGLIWDFCVIRESGQEVCRIYEKMPHADIHRQSQWPNIFNFLIENMLKLEANFMEIRDAVQEEIRPE
jgi:hypothetical protein